MTVNKENEQLIIVDNKNLVHAFEFETFNQLTLVRQFSISGNVHEPSDLGVYKGYVSCLKKIFKVEGGGWFR